MYCEKLSSRFYRWKNKFRERLNDLPEMFFQTGHKGGSPFKSCLGIMLFYVLGEVLQSFTKAGGFNLEMCSKPSYPQRELLLLLGGKHGLAKRSAAVTQRGCVFISSSQVDVLHVVAHEIAVKRIWVAASYFLQEALLPASPLSQKKILLSGK